MSLKARLIVMASISTILAMTACSSHPSPSQQVEPKSERTGSPIAEAASLPNSNRPTPNSDAATQQQPSATPTQCPVTVAQLDSITGTELEPMDPGTGPYKAICIFGPTAQQGVGVSVRIGVLPTMTGKSPAEELQQIRAAKPDDGGKNVVIDHPEWGTAGFVLLQYAAATSGDSVTPQIAFAYTSRYAVAVTFGQTPPDEMFRQVTTKIGALLPR